MIHLRLAGGLGNQLFQMAAALLLAERLQTRVSVLTAALARYEVPRQPDALRLLDWDSSPLASAAAVSPGLRWLIDRARIGRWLPTVGVHDGNLAQALASGTSARGWRVLDGYFQDGWPADLLSQGIAQLMPRVDGHCSGLAGMEPAFAGCRLHVRGGDFLRLPQYAVATEAFYRRALDIAIADGQQHFDVVTDDAPYAQALLAPMLTKRADGVSLSFSPTAADPLTDLQRLRHAHYRIIGNSTFAWWAAALDPAQGKTIAPTQLQLGRPKAVRLPWETCLTSDGALA